MQIDLRVCSLKEHVERWVLRLVICPTEDMCADGMTEGFTPYKFAQHRDVMLGQAPHTAPLSTERGDLWQLATAQVLLAKVCSLHVCSSSANRRWHGGVWVVRV